jgi:Uncharacterized protein conserved in bacteria (DUF2252)
MAEEDDLLVLQYKEAVASVLEPFVGKSKYPNHAQRVVCGQRIRQSASDMFLGWSSVDGRQSLPLQSAFRAEIEIICAQNFFDRILGELKKLGITISKNGPDHRQLSLP